MAQVIDALIVTLGLDQSNFTAGQKQAVEQLRATETAANRTAKSLQSDGAKAAEFFSSIKTQALALFGVLMGGRGVTSVIADMTKGLAEFGRTVGMIGGDPQKIQAFEAAIARMGGTVEGARGALLGLSKARQDWALGRASTDQVAFMQAIGAMVTDDPLTIMEKFSGYVRRNVGTPQGEARIRQFGEGAGLGAVVPFMIQMEKISSFADEMRKSFELGAVASRQQIEAATRFQTSTVAFGQAIDGFVRALIPWERMAEGLERLTDRILHPEKSQVEADRLNDELLKRGHPFARPPLGSRTGIEGWLDRNLPSWLGGTGGAPTSGGPSSGGPRGPLSAPRVPGQAAATMNQAREFFRGKGLSEAETAGILANMNAESGFNPNISGDGGSSYGLFQHHDERMRRLFAFSGTDKPSAQQQLDFAWHELQTSERNTLDRMRGRSASDAAAIFSRDFERPKDREGEAARRGASASQFVRPGLPAGPPPDPALTPRRMLKESDMMLKGAPVSNDNSSMVTIGGITVNTPATDTKGIVRDINREMSDAIAAQSNRGLR